MCTRFCIQNSTAEELDSRFAVRPEYQGDVPKTHFKPRVRKTLSARRWKVALSQDGHVDIAGVLKRIQTGGVHPSIKGVVWEFLLGCFNPNSTFDERNELRQRRRGQYEAWKAKCQKMVPIIGSGKFITTPIITDDGQPINDPSTNSDLGDNSEAMSSNDAGLDKKVTQWKLGLHQIGLDVIRTDRTLIFYESEANQTKLWNVLAIYAWVDNSIGYVQGMNDICSPMVILMENEADAFWCFAGRLENPDAEEVKDFVEKQVKLTESVLEKCDAREKLREKITKLFDHPRYCAPFRRGKKYFYFHNSGLQPQSVLFMQDSLDGEPEVLVDPNGLSEDGTVSMRICAVSQDAKYLAYGLSSSGSDWITIKVMQIENKTIEPDTVSWVKFSCASWTHDSKGFFYSRYPAPKESENLDAGTETSANLNHEVYYHFLGTNQSEDILCWRDPENPKHKFCHCVTDDGKYLLLTITESCKPVNKVLYYDISALVNGLEHHRGRKDLLPFVKLIDNFDAEYDAIANDDTLFTFRTNKDAPKYKLVRVDLKEPTAWFDVLQEAEKDVLQSAVAVNVNQVVVSYLSDVKYVLQLRDLKTGSLLHRLPIDIGTVSEIRARREDSTVFIGFTSFLTPGIIYQCNLDTGVPDMKIFREIVVPGFDRTAFDVNQVFFTSKDGTKIPMFIVATKNIPLDGSHPCLLYAYGGFNISITPYFSVSRIVLTKHLGVIFCLANIRGGGEYGEGWHKAGSLANKQNCFDDFISAAEYLVSSRYTQPKKLCIEGGSNGGLLIGACINQRPDLFGCALAHVGVMDMLRFHKFTIGHAWTSDFGCSEKEEEFHWLIKYSPLHNVRRPWEQSSDQFSQYPATMLLTADHDDRVVPLHSLKLLATMQYVLCTSLEKSPQKNPIVGRIECKAGHGAGLPTQKVIDEAADRFSFMAKMLGASWTD